MRKFNKIKINKRTVLKRFYDLFIIDQQTGNRTPATEANYEQYFLYDNVMNAEVEDYYVNLGINYKSVSIKDFTAATQVTFDFYKDQFEDVKLEYKEYDGGSPHSFEIVGYNKETDEDYNQRKQEYDAETARLLEQKAKHNEEQKIKKIARLKKELEELNE